MRETVPTINVNFYSEPTPDGLYDYKLVLPTGPINGIRISVAEVNVTTTGLTYTKKTCKKKRRGKCVKTQDQALVLVHRAAVPAQRAAQLRGVLRVQDRAGPAEEDLDSLPGLR